MSLPSFENAVEPYRAKAVEPHLLMGNGFSRAWRDSIFNYGALFSRADFQGLSTGARRAFEVLETNDFEIVMRALRSAAVLLSLYRSALTDVAAEMEGDAIRLREVLVRAIAGSHPARPGEVSVDQFRACKAFLKNFKTYYTINYDLLLYWALMQDQIAPDLKCDDGFRTPEAGESAYVTWEPDNTRSQTVHYLHGALHLFDAGTEIQKYTWTNTGTPLIEQVRQALDNNLYPLFVAGGLSRDKLDRIRHSAYLAKMERSFLAISGVLFVFGMSFGESDSHVMRWIGRNGVSELWVSVFGNPATSDNQRMMRQVEALPKLRSGRKKLTVQFYDATSARVWG